MAVSGEGLAERLGGGCGGRGPHLLGGGVRVDRQRVIGGHREVSLVGAGSVCSRAFSSRRERAMCIGSLTGSATTSSSGLPSRERIWIHSRPSGSGKVASV